MCIAVSSCGGGGGGSTSGPATPTGGVEGYVYVPIGSEPVARIAVASTPQAGYKALADADVKATSGSTVKKTKTSSDGYFSLSGLPTGNCSVTVSKTGYTSYTSTNVKVTSGGKTAVGGTAGVVMSPSTSGSVEITTNVPGATIYVDGANTNMVMSGTEYTLGNLSPGSHSVSVSLTGFRAVTAKAVNIQSGTTATAEFMLIGNNNKIVFTSQRNSDWANDERIWELFTMNPDGTEQKTVGNKKGCWTSISQDGNYIFYTPTTDASESGLCKGVTRINIDGTNWTCIPPINSTQTGAPVRISYDGKFVLFVGLLNGCVNDVFYDNCREIFSMNIDGTNVKRITHNDYPEDLPAISPDGKTIVFIMQVNPDGPYYFYKANIDDGIPTLINVPSVYDYSFSPDGKKIAFTLDPEHAIYTINTDGTNLTKLAQLDRYVTEISYSPDGTRIAYVVYYDDYYMDEIYVMGADGTNQQRLTYSRGSDYDISWTP